MRRPALLLPLLLACSGPEGRPDGAAEHAHPPAAMDRSLGGWAEEFRDVRLAIVEPQPGQVYGAGDVHVRFSIENYPLQEPGPHIHLIVDDQPYIAVYDAEKGHRLTGLAPGAHVIRAFPSRPWHESIKSSPHAFATVRFAVGEDDGAYPLDPGAPLFTFSRPKGAYAGEDADRIMFDWYLRSVELSGDGHRVRWILDGEEHHATSWEPIWWEDLAPGEHTIEAGLVDAEGNRVDNAGLNWTRRTFTVKRSEEETP